MRRSRYTAFKVGLPVSIVAVAGVWIGTTAAAEPSQQVPQPVPPWVNVDGSVDMSKVPELMGVLGPDGRPVRDANGKPVTVNLAGLMAPPSGPGRAPDTAKRHIVVHENGVREEIVTDADRPVPGR